MPLFQGHKDSGVQRLFIEMPDNQKDLIAWKWPDQQIIQHSVVNVDLDYLAVFTNLGKVIGKQGRTARSIRTILGAASMKAQHRFSLDIQRVDEPPI